MYALVREQEHEIRIEMHVKMCHNERVRMLSSSAENRVSTRRGIPRGEHYAEAI